MKRTFARIRTTCQLLACLVTAAVGAAPVQGQMHHVVDIPYSFTVPASKSLLPAGSYSITQNSDFLVLESNKGQRASQTIITRLTGPNSFLQAGALVFDSSNGRKVLSEVWLPGKDGFLVHSVPKGHIRDVVSFSDLSQNGHASGKDAFDLTCARCHGDGGKGNPAADHFFGLTIPRLNTPLVQNKSDAELRQIITSGTQVMPPVEVEEAGFRHRLPPQDIDAVVAYLRTLKQ